MSSKGKHKDIEANHCEDGNTSVALELRSMFPELK